MVAAISKDGFLTKGDDPNPSHWTSKEDKEHYMKLVSQYSLQVMGRTTYEAYKFNPSNKILRVVLTRDPRKYADSAVPGELEFYTLSPEEFVEKFEDTYPGALLSGGASIFKQFLDQKLVDTIFITIEPMLNGSGIPLFSEGSGLEDLLEDFDLTSSDNLNESGTMLNRYDKK